METAEPSPTADVAERPRTSGGVTALIAVATVAVVIGNALVLMLGPWLVDIVYALPGVPDDRYGLADGERRALAITGLESVRPFASSSGLQLATLPDGSPAFSDSEVGHMDDVRTVITGFIVAWIAGMVAMAAYALFGPAARTRAGLRRGLTVGAISCLALVAVTGLAMLIAFDAAFTVFHGLFFEGGSWQFSYTDTLLRLYPQEFWMAAGAIIVGLIVLQAIALLLFMRRDRRDHGPGRGPDASTPSDRSPRP